MLNELFINKRTEEVLKVIEVPEGRNSVKAEYLTGPLAGHWRVTNKDVLYPLEKAYTEKPLQKFKKFL